MYSRDFKEPPQQVIHKGKAEFGTFRGVSSKIDIRDLRSPYANLPLPSFLTNIFIKSNLYYFFNLKNYIGVTGFIDFKVFGIANIILWNKESGKKYSYNVVMPLRRRFVPKKTTDGSCTSFWSKRHIRISWGRQHEHHSLSFRLKGDKLRPSANGFIYSSIQDSMHCDLMFVNPSPVKSRCKATWLTTMKINGHIKIDSEDSEDSEGTALMLLTRAYHGLKNLTSIACAMGTIGDKEFVFELTTSTLDAADSDNYNDNALIINGEATALPPVYMTHSFGKDKQWIIQDTESMIDLTFNPVSISRREINVFPSKTATTVIYGLFDGVLLDKNGEKLILKKIPGLIHENMMRL